MRRQYARLAATCACAVATASFCGAALADPGHGNAANAPGHEQEQAATQPAPPATPPSTPPGQAMKQDNATAPTPKGETNQASREAGAGVKPTNTTTHWTSCATGNGSGVTCTSNDGGQTPQPKADVSKQYGNGTTAAQIAVSHGGVGVTLKGPGNSQPHKVSTCGKPSNRSGGVDVHAVKSYDTSACETHPHAPGSHVTQTETHVCGLTTTSTQVGGVLHHVPAREVCTQAPTQHTEQTQQQTQPTQPQAEHTQSTPSVVVVTPAQVPTHTATQTPSSATGALPATQGPAAAPIAPAQSAVLGAQATVASPATKQANGGVLGTVTHVAGSTLPFTGFPLWPAVLAAVALILAGAALVRRRGADARL